MKKMELTMMVEKGENGYFVGQIVEYPFTTIGTIVHNRWRKCMLSEPLATNQSCYYCELLCLMW
jgi:hypothetical protein